MKRLPLTYVSSLTYDLVHHKMYPDALPVERSLEEIERLLTSGHTIEWRNGTNRTVLTTNTFDTLVKPLYKMYEMQDILEDAKNNADTVVVSSIVSGEPNIISVVPTGENTLITGNTPAPATVLFTPQDLTHTIVTTEITPEVTAPEIIVPEVTEEVKAEEVKEEIVTDPEIIVPEVTEEVKAEEVKEEIVTDPETKEETSTEETKEDVPVTETTTTTTVSTKKRR